MNVKGISFQGIHNVKVSNSSDPAKSIDLPKEDNTLEIYRLADKDDCINKLTNTGHFESVGVLGCKHNLEFITENNDPVKIQGDHQATIGRIDGNSELSACNRGVGFLPLYLHIKEARDNATIKASENTAVSVNKTTGPINVKLLGEGSGIKMDKISSNTPIKIDARKGSSIYAEKGGNFELEGGGNNLSNTYVVTSNSEDPIIIQGEQLQIRTVEKNAIATLK